METSVIIEMETEKLDCLKKFQRFIIYVLFTMLTVVNTVTVLIVLSLINLVIFIPKIFLTKLMEHSVSKNFAENTSEAFPH